LLKDSAVDLERKQAANSIWRQKPYARARHAHDVGPTRSLCSARVQGASRRRKRWSRSIVTTFSKRLHLGLWCIRRCPTGWPSSGSSESARR